LHELSELGLVRELDLGLGMGERRYDVATGRHDHVVCLVCGRMEDVPPAGALGECGHEHDFEIVDRRVTYIGYCPDCAAETDVQ
jgi:Fe2+ or Zn2+ uptake regulation protein